MRFLVVLSLVLCISAQAPTPEEEECSTLHPLVGMQFPLTTFSHDVSGTIVIKSDCEFVIEDFVYDGTGPAVYVYGFSEEFVNGDEVPAGTIETEMDFLPRGESYDGSEPLPVSLPIDVTWDDIKVISIWCERFGIDFGSAVLDVV